jgi:uncharacterized protein (TIGR00730 family)
MSSTPTDLLNAADTETLKQVQADLAAAAAVLSSLAPGITVFGSARSSEQAPEYQAARRLGGWLGAAGIPVITGGGPGVMEAANRGAREQDGISVGLNITLPHEQSPNAYLTHHLRFCHFQTRKLMLTRYSRGFAVFPGGFGTADELLELVVLQQTERVPERPLVLIDRVFWCPMLEWMADQMGSRGFIDSESTDWITVVDDERDALEVLVGEGEAARLQNLISPQLSVEGR